MSRIAIIVPTVGRDSLAATLESLSPQLQAGDAVYVVCDRPSQYDFCCTLVDRERTAHRREAIKWRTYTNIEPLGQFGHPSRNKVLEHLWDMEDAPVWVWSLDDDDIASFGALDMIRSAIDADTAPWYIFRMVGGEGSHFPGLVVPATGNEIKPGSVGTPMIVFPVGTSRFGSGSFPINPEPGYFGDYELTVALEEELGEPEWRPEIVAEIRPVAE